MKNHSVLDKIIYFLFAVGSAVVFIWDIIQDFIPEEYWQLKLSVIIIGALSGFFTVLSFLWDKKFKSVSKEILVAQNEKFDKLSADLQVFLEEDFRSYTSFNDAIMPIIKSKNEFNEVKIFAYSAKNYIECLMRSNVRIKRLCLCLKLANDYSAWFMHNENRANKYQNELKLVMKDLNNLKDREKVAEYEVRFYDFEPYSHFGIFDDQMLCGDLIPLFSEKKTVQIGKIQTLKNIGRNEDFFTNKSVFFNRLFASSVSDSGLKLPQQGCHYCETNEMIQDPHHMNGTVGEFGKCDISLIDNVDAIQDFILEPDFHPISELHMLLVCKFHSLNLYDYLCHKDAAENLERSIYKIRDVIYKQTKQEIILFEHGTSTLGSLLSASSIEHLHIHIIYKPKTYDYISAVVADNAAKQEPVFDTNKGCILFDSIHEFANSGVIKNKDYFMIWEPGKSKTESKIYVWLPIKKESQYLRRIFFQGLSNEEKEKLYGSGDGQFDDEYNWKTHKFKYTDDRLAKHLQIGKEIKACLK